MTETEALARPRLVGARVLRKEDARFLMGAARYVDDVNLPGMVHGCVLRSPLPHARIVRADAAAALAREDVVDVLTPEVVAAATRPIRCVWIMPGQRQESYPVCPDIARHAGEAIGFVVARTRAAAEDAAELVDLDLEPLDGVSDAERALEEGAPLLNPNWGTNVAIEREAGDPPEVIEEAIARAAHVVSRTFRVQRVAGSPLEPRGAVAAWEPATRSLTLWTSTQCPHHVREQLAHCLSLSAESIRVIALDVGGGFGNKEHMYPEEVLVSLASMRLGVPVKWIEDRREALVSTIQARDQIYDARLALDEKGGFLAIHSHLIQNLGSRPSNVGGGPALIASFTLPGPYEFEAAGVSFRAVLTNKTPSGAYRGFGMQQSTWVRERLIDEAARELGVEPVELRLRNMIRPEQMPYTTRTGQTYESGDYPRALRRAAELVREGHDPPDDGRRRGIGFAFYVEIAGMAPTRLLEAERFRLAGYETAVVRMETDGTATVLMGTSSQGQAHETTFAQIAADALGLSVDDVRVLAGDTATTPYSSASAIASRSMALGGGALVRASGRLRDKLLRIGGELLEAAPDDLELAEGAVRVRGAAWRRIPLAEVAGNAWLGWRLPEGDSAGLEEKDVHDPVGLSYPYAAHAAAVAVDPDTGEIEVERLVVVHDCGTVVNPMVVEGQIEGAAAQGIGIALLEEVAYDEEGNPLTTTLMDYLLPTSPDVPDVTIEHIDTPSPYIPGGMKGAGEGGTIGAPAAIGNAVAAALPEISGLVTETPLSPARVWGWLRGAGGAS